MEPPRILVVEDEPVIALHLCEILTRFGYDVPESASSAEQFLRTLESTRPDLVLMDINIDGAMDGISAASSIPPEYEIPVIYLTAYASDETLSRACDTNPYGYILKPFTEREVHAMIQTALARSRAEKETRARESERRRVWQMDMSSHLAGRVAQDFNNLLSVMFDDLEILNEDAALHPEQRDLVKSIELAAGRAEALAGRLLAFSGRAAAVPGPVSLTAFFASVMSAVGHVLGLDVRISLSLPTDLWSVWVDPDAFELALMNIVTNARDAMPLGGLLGIEACNVLLDDDQASPDGRYVLLSISDSGRGMPKQVAERACEPFFTGGTGVRGAGLGLSQVFGFTRQAGGRLAIDSKIGHGTTVRIHLPAAPKNHPGGNGIVIPSEQPL